MGQRSAPGFPPPPPPTPDNGLIFGGRDGNRVAPPQTGFPMPPPSSGGPLANPPPASNPLGSALDGIGSAISGGIGALTGANPQGPQPAQAAPPASSGNPAVDRVRRLAQIAVSPYADGATREMAGKLLEQQMGMLQPQYQFVTRPDGSIEAINPRNPRASVEAAGPMKADQIVSLGIDPATGYEIKGVWNAVEGVKGVIKPNGSLAPIGAKPNLAPPAGDTPVPPPGVDPKKWRETLAERNAAEVTPNAADELRFTQNLTDRQSYKEFSQSLPTYNALTQHIRDNSPSADKAIVDDFAKILNPGRSVTTGAFVLNLDAQSLPAELAAKIAKAWSGDGELGPEARAQMASVAREKMLQYQGAWNVDAEQGKRAAARHKLSLDAVPTFPGMSPLDLAAVNSTKTQASAPAPTPSPSPVPAQVPESAAQYLRAHPETRGEFDRKFGPGASARVLGNG